MICKNCGKELNVDFKICPYCGNTVESTENDKLNNTETVNTFLSKMLANKKTTIIICVILIVVVAIIAIIVTNGNKSANTLVSTTTLPSFEEYMQNETGDNFGNNETVTAVEEEKIDIEVICPYGVYDSMYGSMELKNYKINNSKNMYSGEAAYHLYLFFEGTEGKFERGDIVSYTANFYDANDNLIGNTYGYATVQADGTITDDIIIKNLNTVKVEIVDS